MPRPGTNETSFPSPDIAYDYDSLNEVDAVEATARFCPSNSYTVTEPTCSRLYANVTTYVSRLFSVSAFGELLRMRRSVPVMQSLASMFRVLVGRSNSVVAYSLPKFCPVCASPLSETTTPYESATHNPESCRLVNLALSELGVRVPETIRINIYPGAGALRGFYFTADPYAINISEEAYSQIPEYIIFHETKHLVDCLQFGRSEELSPDSFARSLCVKYGYTCPPADHNRSGFAYA